MKSKSQAQETIEATSKNAPALLKVEDEDESDIDNISTEGPYEADDESSRRDDSLTSLSKSETSGGRVKRRADSPAATEKVTKKVKTKAAKGSVAKQDPKAKMSELVLSTVKSMRKGKAGVSFKAMETTISKARNKNVGSIQFRNKLKEAVKTALENKQLVQTSGKGCNGSFKLAPKKK